MSRALPAEVVPVRQTGDLVGIQQERSIDIAEVGRVLAHGEVRAQVHVDQRRQVRERGPRHRDDPELPAELVHEGGAGGADDLEGVG